MNSRRATTLIATLALTITAIVAGSVSAAAATKGGGSPSVQFTRSVLSAGGTDSDGTQYGASGLTLSATEPLTSGVYTDPYATGGPRDISYESGTWTSSPVASFAFDELVASWNAA